jgi:hypothetical protein
VRRLVGWLVVLVSVVLGQNWELMSVLSELEASYSPKIATDSLSLPHIAFGYFGLCYANWTGDDWDFAYVDTSGPLLDIDLCLDGDDVPHIGYAMSRWPEPSEVRYACRDGDTWSIGIADGGCVPGWLTFGALALARDQAPHIVFVDSSTIKYTYKTSDAWNVLTVPADQVDSLRWLVGVSLALDTNDRPGIAVSWWKSHGGSRDSMWLSFFERDSEGWHRFDIDSAYTAYAPYQVWPPRVRNDPATDMFHIVYREGAYASGRDGTWQIEPAPVPPCGQGSCDFVLHHGQPHIVSGGTFPVQYTWRAVDGWQSELVGPLGTVGPAPSIAVDRTGRPHLTFVSADDESLYHARRLFAGTEEPSPAMVQPEFGLVIRPNPAPHAFTLEFPVCSPATATIRLCDALGRTVWSQEEKVFPGQYRRRLSLPARICPGVYFIEVATPTDRDRKKVVLAK